MTTKLKTILALALALLLSACESNTDTPVEAPPQSSQPMHLVVYQNPQCGCCSLWVDHMKEHGFTAEMIEEPDFMARLERAGLRPELSSCHTALVDGYVIEGHVPADDVKRLLSERPVAHGLTVPGMPIGSPGMEHGNRRQAYDVLLFDISGDTQVFNHYPAIDP